jgi:hypothetical protein
VPVIIKGDMSTKGPLRDFDIVFLEDLYKEIEENENIFFIRLSECYYNPLKGVLKELRGEGWTVCPEGMILYLSSEKNDGEYLQYNFKQGDGVTPEKVVASGSFSSGEMFLPITLNVYETLDFNRSIHFSSNKVIAEKMVEKGKEILQRIGVKTKSLFEKFGKGNIFSVEVEENAKLSKYLWDKGEVRERIPSYFNRPSQRKMEKLETALRRAVKLPVYLKVGYWGSTVETSIEEEMKKTLTKMNTDSGSLHLPIPLTFFPEEDSIFNTKRIKTSSGVLIRKLSPIAITSQSKSKNAKIVKVAFLHRYGTYRHENKNFGEIDVHLLEPILIAEYTNKEKIPFEVITSQKQRGSSNGSYKMFLIEKPKEIEDKGDACKDKKKIKVKYEGEINLIGRYDYEGNLGKLTLGSVSIETSGTSTIEIDLEKGEAREIENQANLEVKEHYYKLSEDIVNWALYGTKDSALIQTPPAPLVILQVLRDVAKGDVPKHEKNREIPEEYLESIRRRYEWVYHLFYDWFRRVIRSIDTDSHKLPKELEGVNLLEKKVREKLIGKEGFLERAKSLCVKTEDGEKFTITVDFEKENTKKLQYSWGEKIFLRGFKPLNITLPISYIIDESGYSLLFAKSKEEKLEKINEIRSINIVVKYEENLKAKSKNKVEVTLELEIISIEIEFCDGARISNRSRIMMQGGDRIQNYAEIWYSPEEVTEKLKRTAKSLIGTGVRSRRR